MASSGPLPLAHHRENHGVHVLHVHRASTPHHGHAGVLFDLRRERWVCPVGGIGGDDVEMTMQQQAAGRERSSPAMRANTLVRPGADSTELRLDADI